VEFPAGLHFTAVQSFIAPAQGDGSTTTEGEKDGELQNRYLTHVSTIKAWMKLPDKTREGGDKGEGGRAKSVVGKL
jgi:hypothetical protein